MDIGGFAMSTQVQRIVRGYTVAVRASLVVIVLHRCVGLIILSRPHQQTKATPHENSLRLPLTRVPWHLPGFTPDAFANQLGSQRPISWCASGDSDSAYLHEHPVGRRKVSRPSLPWQGSPAWPDRRTSAKQPPIPPPSPLPPPQQLQQQLPVSQSLLNSCSLVTQPGSGDLSYLKSSLGGYALAGAGAEVGVGHRALDVNLAHVCTSGGSMDAAFGATQDDEEATAPGPGTGGGAPVAGGGGGGGPARCRPTNIRPIEMNDSACPASTCGEGLHGALLMHGIYTEKGARGATASTSPGLLRGNAWRPSDWAGSVALQPLG